MMLITEKEGWWRTVEWLSKVYFLVKSQAAVTYAQELCKEKKTPLHTHHTDLGTAAKTLYSDVIPA